MPEVPVFGVELEVLSTQEGGRRGPLQSGYRGTVWFGETTARELRRRLYRWGTQATALGVEVPLVSYASVDELNDGLPVLGLVSGGRGDARLVGAHVG